MCQWDFPVDEPVSMLAYRRHHLDEEIPAIVRCMSGGARLRELAGEYGVSREAIRRALIRAGVTIAIERIAETGAPPRRPRAHRLPGRGRSRAFEPAEVSALLTRHVGGESLRSLARGTGVSHETIRRVLGGADCADARNATA